MGSVGAALAAATRPPRPPGYHLLHSVPSGGGPATAPDYRIWPRRPFGVGMSERSGEAPAAGGTELATFGGGCFWCTEAVFDDLRGVEEVTSGYAGGTVANPSYEDVCTGRTGHAEVTQIRFRPAELSFRDLLRVFFTVHDPTTRNRQGADVGTQYRSIVLYHDEAQRRAAEEVKAEVDAAHLWRSPIVTEIAPFQVFYPAEEYHRDYYRRNPERSYCQLVIAPKVAKFRKQYLDRLKSGSTTLPARAH
jgi:peptide-methionine (S)-S-oxide reductase